MCHWRYEVYRGEGFDEPLASIPFQGGVRPNEESRARTLVKVRRQLAGYANAHPAARTSLRIVEMSCNGPQREIRPYADGGEEHLLIGGWEGRPGEPEVAAQPPTATDPRLLRGLSPLREQDDVVAPSAEPIDGEQTAVVALRDGQQVAVFPDAESALTAITGWSDDERRGLVAYEVDLHGESLGKVWPGADLLARRLAGRELPQPSEAMTVDDLDAVARYFARPVADPWRDVRAHFESFARDDVARAAALERLRRWASIASQDVQGGGRANDEMVSLRASILYSLRHALRALEAAEGQLLVGHDDHWQPYPVKTVDSLAEARAAIEEIEQAGQSAAVYAIERHGQVGDRLYPREATPYTVWSMATANLLGEYASADEAIAVCHQDPDDLVAFLDDGAETTVVYDPNGLTRLTAAARRERLERLSREGASHVFREQEVD